VPRRAVATIDLAILRRNYRTLAAVSGRAECAAVVKGDAYGLGLVPAAVAAWQAGARLFFVAHFEDGARLRRLMPNARIAILDGLAGRQACRQFERARLMPVLCDIAEARCWFSARRSVPAMVHIDTGMNRSGISSNRIEALSASIGPTSAIACYMTQLVSADDIDLQLCHEQVVRFHAAVATLPPAPLSITNSAGLFLDPAWRADITRPGKALAGINPIGDDTPSPVTQVMEVSAPILQIRGVRRGESVGYAESFRARAEMRIATLGIGYADGYLRSLSDRGIAAVDGHRCRVVGRVSMDLVTIDVSAVPAASLALGVAELCGPTISLSALAKLAGTNEHELQIALGRGCHRIHANDKRITDDATISGLSRPQALSGQVSETL
jgi:alanine racemase